MSWTANLIIQIVFGILGSHVIAVAAHEHSFGALGHTIVGAVAGALSGYFLQSAVVGIEGGSGFFNQPNAVELAIGQALAGAITGGIAMLLVGFLKHVVDQHKARAS